LTLFWPIWAYRHRTLTISSVAFHSRAQAPLDMRMDQSQAVTASTILNTYPEDRLADILQQYGEEPKARQIARLIVENRPLTTTRSTGSHCCESVARLQPGSSRYPNLPSYSHRRTNDELGLLTQSLPLWLQLLAPGGRIAVISFHSLEDRLVKEAFKAVSGKRYDAELELLTKRPVTASADELVHNPRARSAKLRAAVKIKT
jgi:16S rRNA (cytosine1402-N4)-methyltransferase